MDCHERLQPDSACSQTWKAGDYFCETIDSLKPSPGESQHETNCSLPVLQHVDHDNSLECNSTHSHKQLASLGDESSAALDLRTPHSGQRPQRLKRSAEDLPHQHPSPCQAKRRSQVHRLCANPNCANQQEVKKRFANKLALYCTACAHIIDQREYCHICLEITSPQEKRWAACDRCKCWNHISCEEKLRKGIKNLQAKLENPNYFYICGNCRSSGKKCNNMLPKAVDQTRKMSEVSQALSRESLPAKDAVYQSFFDVCRLTAQKKKVAAPANYIYFYSENYQLVDKMVASLGKRLQLTGDELDDDLQALFQADRNLLFGRSTDDACRSERKKLVAERPVGAMSTRSMAVGK